MLAVATCTGGVSGGIVCVANRDFGEKLLRAKDFQEAFRIQVEYFQSQWKACAEDATQIGAKIAGSFKQTG